MANGSSRTDTAWPPRSGPAAWCERGGGNETQQTAYTQAQRAYELADARHGKYEQDFLAARSITDRGGRPARHIWQVEDDALFDRLEEKYQADPVATQLQADYTAARVVFIRAEKDLISWALSIVPAVVRNTLAPAAKQDATTRKKIIDLALQLDSRMAETMAGILFTMFSTFMSS